MRSEFWLSLPDADEAGPGQVKLSTYWQHFVDINSLPNLWKQNIGFQKLSAVLRFRLGCHDLAVEKGRWANIPRADRHCPHCRGVIQDEHHFVFVCPFNSSIRSNYPMSVGAVSNFQH